MRLVSWLYPGLGVKRWLLLFSAGVALLALGAGLVVHTNVLAVADSVLSRVAYALTGRFLAPEALGLLAALAGLLLVVVGARGAVRSILAVVAPSEVRGLAERVYERRYLPRGPRVVAVGGGTGLSAFLQGAKEYTYNITAIVTVTDDGGSSGRLRGELGIPPPGDVRNALVALADTEPLMEAVLQHRFGRGALKGHSLGNLFLGALCESLGSFEEAVRAASRVLAVRGQVLPSTAADVRLVAEFADGRTVVGETAIVAAGREGRRIRSLALLPPDCRALPEAIAAVREADAIVLGPGSLYTSVLPNLLVPDLREAIRRSRALRVYVVNVMTQPGETDGMTAAEHLAAVEALLGPGAIDAVIVHEGPLGEERLRAYRALGSEPVPVDAEALRRRGLVVVAGDFATSEGLIRHDPRRLSRAVMRLLLDRGLANAARLFDRVVLAERLARTARGEAG
ncbi:MAG: YvcK family protein [Clostridia bacterium]|nr:YvcK family protein [Clostridia bacterium]